MKKVISVILFTFSVLPAILGQALNYKTVFTCDFDQISKASDDDPWRHIPLDKDLEGESANKFYDDEKIFSLPSNYQHTSLLGYGIISEMPEVDEAPGGRIVYYSGLKDHTTGNGYMLICKNWMKAISVRGYDLEKGDKVRVSFYTQDLITLETSYGDIFVKCNTQRTNYAGMEYNEEFYDHSKLARTSTEGWNLISYEFDLEKATDSIYVYLCSPTDSYGGACFDDIKVEVAKLGPYTSVAPNQYFKLYKNVNFDASSSHESENPASRGAGMDKTSEGYSSDKYSDTYGDSTYCILHYVTSEQNKDHSYEELRDLGTGNAESKGYYFYGTDYHLSTPIKAGAGDVYYCELYYASLPKAGNNAKFHIEVTDKNKLLYKSAVLQGKNQWEWTPITFSFGLPQGFDASTLTLSVVSEEGNSTPFALDDISIFTASKSGDVKYKIIVDSNNPNLGCVNGRTYQFFTGNNSKEWPCTYTAVPFNGSRFVQWSDGETAAQRTLRWPGKDTTIHAIFEKIDNCISVNITSSNDSLGTVEFEDKCYDLIERCTITAKAEKGCSFVQWSDGVMSPTRVLILTRDTSIVAIFKENSSHTITFVNNNNRNFSVKISSYGTSSKLLMDQSFFGDSGIVHVSDPIPHNTKLSIFSHYLNNHTEGELFRWEIGGQALYTESVTLTLTSDTTIYMYEDSIKEYKLNIQPYDTTTGIAKIYYGSVSHDINDTVPVKVKGIEDDFTYNCSRYPQPGYYNILFMNRQEGRLYNNLIIHSDTSVYYIFDNTRVVYVSSNDSSMGLIHVSTTLDTLTTHEYVKVHNTQITGSFTAEAKPGYKFLGWEEVDEAYDKIKKIQHVSTPTVECPLYQPIFTLRAKFGLDIKHPLNVIYDTTMCDIKGLGEYSDNEMVEVEAIAKPNFAFRYWITPEGKQLSDAKITIPASEEITYEAVCGVDSVRLTIEVNDPLLGMTSGSGKYKAGSTITITAEKKTGGRFMGWEDGVKSESRKITLGWDLQEVSYCAYFVSASGLENVENDLDNGNVDVYTLTGIKIRSNVERAHALDGLDRGIYIVGNKKMIYMKE